MLPPPPVQVSVYVLAAKMELIVSLPETALAPDQAPVAAQFEALVEDQVSCVEPPGATVLGAALSETAGAGAFTITVAELVALPPAPTQLSVNVLVAERELIVWLPEVVFAPDHAPLAVQLEALLDDQVIWVEPPCATVVGAALSETVGAGVGVGVGVCVGAGGDPATGPPPSLLLPPPQATRLKAQAKASGTP